MDAKDIMTANPVTVSPDHGIRHAIQIMLERKISGLPVVDDAGQVVGMLTEGDLLDRSELGIEALAKPDRKCVSSLEARLYVKSNGWRVADVMNRDPLVVDETTPVGRLAQLMSAHAIKRLPVVRDGRLVGIVSRADLLQMIADSPVDRVADGEDAIRRSVLTRLRESAEIVGSDLTATVKAGVVHLWGEAPSVDAVEAARVVVESVHGVDGVASHLAIAKTAAT